MTITFATDDLKPIAALHRRLRLPTITGVPILSHICITLEMGKTEATIESSDLDIHITSRVAVTGPATSGTFTLPRKEFFEILASTDKGSPIRLTTSDDSPHVEILHRSKKLNASTTLIGLPQDEFPISQDTLEDWSGTRHILPSDTVRTIRASIAATSWDETRYVLNGILLDPSGHIVATDGRRLVTTAARVSTPKMILPNKFVTLLADPLLDSAAIVNVHDSHGDTTTPRVAAFIFAKTTICTNLIDGNFPNYLQVIPNVREYSITLAASTVESILPWLRTAAKRNMKSNSVKLEINAGKLRLSCKEPDHSESAISVPVHTTDAPPNAQISFNPAFLADGLSLGLNTLDLIDEMSPGLLTNGTTRYVIMPMRITNFEATEEPATEEQPEEETHQPDPEAIEV